MAASDTLLRIRGRARSSFWGIVVVTITIALYSWIFAMSTPSHDPGQSDGFYNWMFARSLVYDHDLNFNNDYELCGDPFAVGRDYGTGRRANPYYVGPALFWLPAAWVGRFVPLPAGASPQAVAGCQGMRTGGAMGSTVALGVLTLIMLYRICRRAAPDGIAAMSAFIVAWTGPLSNYATIQPSYGHVHEAFATTAAVLLTLRAAEQPQRAMRWLAAGCLVGIALLQKPPLAAFILIPGLVAIDRLRRDWRALGLALGCLAAGLLVCGLIPQLVLNKYLFNTYSIGGSKTPLYVQLRHAHPFLLLFAPRGGLFYWTPTVWLSVIGALMALRRRASRALTVSGLVVCVALVYVSSAVLDWDASSSFGARRLTALAPLFAFWGTVALERIARWLSVGHRMRAFAAIAICVPLVWTFGGASIGQRLDRTTIEHVLNQEQLYGAGAASSWAFVDQEIGDIAVLPAAWLYHLRYHLPLTTFRDATTMMGYHRNVRTLGSLAALPTLTTAPMPTLTRGMATSTDEMKLEAKSSVVFTVQWPFATHVVVDVRTDKAIDLRVGQSRALRQPFWFGTIHVVPGEAPSHKLVIPPGGFDSGINQLVFEYESPANVYMRQVQFEDQTVYPPPP